MSPSGFPEGVVWVRYGVASPDEFELYGNEIVKGGRQTSVHQIIVAPAPGYTFVEYPSPNRFIAAKTYEEPQTIVAAFTVKNSLDAKRIDDALRWVADLRTKEETEATPQ